jgi:hypothetical protein
MIVAYCPTCLPAKVVLGYSDMVSEIKAPHDAHPQIQKNGYFPISRNGWQVVFVEGDDAQTKTNIVAQFSDRFESKDLPA